MDSKSKKSKIHEFLTFVWNPKRSEFLGRDGKSWAKISLFYAVFYACLGGFFIGCLFVFRQTLSDIKPRYYGSESRMELAKDQYNSSNRVNPGLGYRPQLDPESSLIFYPFDKDSKKPLGDAEKLTKSLETFLNNTYGKNINNYIDNCQSLDLSETRKKLRNGQHCKFDYSAVIGNIDSHLGYEQGKPLVLLKVNKIYDWEPVSYETELPNSLSDIKKKLSESQLSNFDKILQNNIIIKCYGEYAADIDIVDKLKVKYYSAESHDFESDFGIIPFYYYPFLNQKGYESPAVFVRFDFTDTTDQLVNILCKAHTQNIDSTDKYNKRGMTQFSFYVEAKN